MKITVSYYLSQKGQKQSFMNGGNGKHKQSLEIDTDNAQLIDLSTVNDVGQANIFIQQWKISVDYAGKNYLNKQALDLPIKEEAELLEFLSSQAKEKEQFIKKLEKEKQEEMRKYLEEKKCKSFWYKICLMFKRGDCSYNPPPKNLKRPEKPTPPPPSPRVKAI